MRVSKRLLDIAIIAILVLAVTAPSLAQTAVPTRTGTPTVEEPEDEQETVVTEEAQIIAEAGDASGLELTIYNQSMGLVREVRSAVLDEGLNEISVTNIPNQIIPASVYMMPLKDDEGTVLLEQRFDYDVVNSSGLLQRYIDETISLTTQSGESLTGTLISVSDDIVLLTDWGIEIIRSSQVQQFSLPTLSEPLITRPTLTWLLQATEAGERDYRLTYLTGGLTWQADYVAMLNEDDSLMDLQSWISIRNDSGASFEDAKLKLVAGEVNQVREQVAYEAEEVYKVVEAAAPAPGVVERGLMDYHLYDVARPVTLKDNQSKQLEFLKATGITVEKQYVFEVTSPIWVSLGSAVTDAGYLSEDRVDIQVKLMITNDEESGLGLPIPQGTVRIYKDDVDGSAILVGQDTVSHTPANEIIRLSLGNAFDLVGERRQTQFRQLGERSLEETIEITLRNQSDEEATIQVIEHLYRAHDAEITESSEDYTQVDANTVQFDVTVDAEETATVSYTVVYRW